MTRKRLRSCQRGQGPGLVTGVRFEPTTLRLFSGLIAAVWNVRREIKPLVVEEVKC